MTVALISPSKLAKPSAVIATSMTDKERLAFGTREIDLCIDVGERAAEYAGVVLRDRARNLACPVTGGALSTLNAYPAIDFSADAGGKIAVPYQVPSSYFIAVLCSLDTTTTTNSFAASADTSGDRLFFGVLGNAHPYLSHGFDAGESLDWAPPPTATGTHVWWGSFDVSNGQAAIGLDAVTAGITGTISVPHKGWATTDFFGGSGVAEIDGKAALAIVVPRYLGGAAQAAPRAAILAWLAEVGGVALGA